MKSNEKMKLIPNKKANEQTSRNNKKAERNSLNIKAKW